jgi:hypothetical protein
MLNVQQKPTVSFLNNDTIDTNGTSLMGYITTTYDELVEKFGEPTYRDDLDKSTVEWTLKFVIKENNFGGKIHHRPSWRRPCSCPWAAGDMIVLATIYDWKVYHTPKNKYDWHIGGHGFNSVDMVTSMMKGEQ